MAQGLEQHQATEQADTAETFSLLGHEKRLSILTALNQGDSNETLSFSTLFKQVEITDSAVFNYHLNELRPEFARKDGSEYRLTAAGRRLARAVAAGTYSATPELEPFEIEGVCYACGAQSLRARYQDEEFRIRCAHCDTTVIEVHTPPTVIRNRERKAAVDAFDQWARLEVKQAQSGVCPSCGGPVTPRLSADACADLDMDVVATYECDVCSRRVVSSVAGVAFENPTIKQFLSVRDANFDERRYWEIEHYVSDEHVEIISGDPWRVRVIMTAGGDECRVELTEALEVDKIDIKPNSQSQA